MSDSIKRIEGGSSFSMTRDERMAGVDPEHAPILYAEGAEIQEPAPQPLDEFAYPVGIPEDANEAYARGTLDPRHEIPEAMVQEAFHAAWAQTGEMRPADLIGSYVSHEYDSQTPPYPLEDRPHMVLGIASAYPIPQPGVDMHRATLGDYTQHEQDMNAFVQETMATPSGFEAASRPLLRRYSECAVTFYGVANSDNQALASDVSQGLMDEVSRQEGQLLEVGSMELGKGRFLPPIAAPDGGARAKANPELARLLGTHAMANRYGSDSLREHVVAAQADGSAESKAQFKEFVRNNRTTAMSMATQSMADDKLRPSLTDQGDSEIQTCVSRSWATHSEDSRPRVVFSCVNPPRQAQYPGIDQYYQELCGCIRQHMRSDLVYEEVVERFFELAKPLSNFVLIPYGVLPNHAAAVAQVHELVKAGERWQIFVLEMGKRHVLPPDPKFLGNTETHAERAYELMRTHLVGEFMSKKLFDARQELLRGNADELGTGEGPMTHMGSVY